MDNNAWKLLILILVFVPPVFAQEQPNIKPPDTEDARTLSAVETCIAYQDQQFAQINKRFDIERDRIEGEIKSDLRLFKIIFSIGIFGALLLASLVTHYIMYKIELKNRDAKKVLDGNTKQEP